MILSNMLKTYNDTILSKIIRVSPVDDIAVECKKLHLSHHHTVKPHHTSERVCNSHHLHHKLSFAYTDLEI